SNVLAKVQAGANAVLSGNYQVTEEEALPSLRAKFNSENPFVTLTARDLVRWSLPFLHPITMNNFVNNPLGHNSHTNRLFWRVDANTILGRFFLMHMLAIRPEVTDFRIEAACDYSFVPEMCPSGNVSIVSDS